MAAVALAVSIGALAWSIAANVYGVRVMQHGASAPIRPCTQGMTLAPGESCGMVLELHPAGSRPSGGRDI